LVSLVFLIGILQCIQVEAQLGERTLSGRVTSPSGIPVAHARLVLKDSTSSDMRSVTVNSDGTYLVANLLPGTYEITASAQGFADAHATVAISADGKPVVNLVMQPGGTAAAGKGQVGSSPVKGDVTTSVSELPLNGRSASDVAALEPGVATARTQASGQAQRGFGTEMTISGGRPRQNDSRLDGISVNDYSNGPPGSALGVNLGVDAVEQFSVLTSNYPAQHGRSSGGIIGASTRSGTSEFHGSVYEFFRNSALDARNFFNTKDTKKPPFRRNQFGVSLGGPIQKDRTFIFGDYEGLRSSTGVTQLDTVPSAAARAGISDPTVLGFVNAFYPLPNGTVQGVTGNFTFSGQQVTPENYFTTKVDHKISEKDEISGTYMFDAGTVRQPDELNDKRTGYDSRRQVFTVNETHTFIPGFLSSFRFGINRVVATTGLTFPSGNPHASDGSFFTVPGKNAPGVEVTGLTLFSGGLGSPSNFNFYWTSIQAYEDFSFNRGKHTLKFGVGLERIRDNMFGVSDTGGVFSFNSVSDFLNNVPYFLSVAIPSAVTERGIRQTIFGAYIQDDWHWRPNVTVNLGLRYEMATVPTEVHGKLSVLRQITDPLPVCGVLVPDSCSATGPLFSNPTLRNFEPRLGVSWDPFGNGKTAISAGFGMFDVLPLPYLIQFNALFSAPFFKAGSATNLPAGSFPSTAFAYVGSPNTFRQAYFDPHPRRNYVMQWNLTIQRELARDLSAMVGFVGSRGVHQPFRVEDVDIVMPTLTSQGYLWPSPASNPKRLNENAGRITAGFWAGDSYYDALETQIKKKIARGSLEVSYTWSKSIDTSSSSLVGDEYTNSISSPLFFNPRLNRGLSDFNIAQNLEINYTWEIGTPKWASGSKAWALAGWQIGGVFEASTGVPFTPGIGGDALGVKSTDPNIDVPNLIAGPGCGSPVNPGNPVSYIKTQCFAVPNPITLRGNLGRNTLIGPGLTNFDFSLFKNNYIKRISDRFNAQFRAEFFNILNHANFAPPLDNRNIFDSTGVRVANAGLITSTQTPSRQIQFAVKLIW